MMQRRTILAGTGFALTSAVAGCLGQLTGNENSVENGGQNGVDNGDENGTGDGSANRDENGSGDGSETGDEGQGSDGNDADIDGTHYEITSTGPVGGSPLEHDVRLVQPHIDSPDGPLTLAMTVTNTGSETIRYGEARNALGMYKRAGDFVLHPPSERPQFDEETGLWYVAEPVAITMEFRVGELEPGASDAQRLELIYDGEDPPESVPESFDFALSYGVTVGENEIPDGEDGFEWHFTLERVE